MAGPIIAKATLSRKTIVGFGCCSINTKFVAECTIYRVACTLTLEVVISTCISSLRVFWLTPAPLTCNRGCISVGRDNLEPKVSFYVFLASTATHFSCLTLCKTLKARGSRSGIITYLYSHRLLVSCFGRHSTLQWLRFTHRLG